MSTLKTQPEEKGFFDKIKDAVNEFWNGSDENTEKPQKSTKKTWISKGRPAQSKADSATRPEPTDTLATATKTTIAKKASATKAAVKKQTEAVSKTVAKNADAIKDKAAKAAKPAKKAVATTTASTKKPAAKKAAAKEAI